MQIAIDTLNQIITLADKETANGFIELSFEQLGVINGLVAKAVKNAEDAAPEPPRAG